jgi:trehalose-phosphatase
MKYLNITPSKSFVDFLWISRTPGSYIETKDVSLTWHFGLAEPSFANWQASELQNHIEQSIGKMFPIHAVRLSKSVQVMPVHANKGIAMRRILDHHRKRCRSRTNSSGTSPAMGYRGNLVICIGHGRLDEELFEHAEQTSGSEIITVTIGRKRSAAKWHIRSIHDMGRLLEGLSAGMERDECEHLQPNQRSSSAISLHRIY